MVEHYYDDADRWLRNYFAEIQLGRRAAEALERLASSHDETPITYNGTTNEVTARNIGAFAGWPAPNDWVHHIGIQHCCTGNGARAIYYAWENILHYADGELRVNLLLNRASPWADVHSSIPYEGRVDITVKTVCAAVNVRVPEWVDRATSEIECTVNEETRALLWDGRYLSAGTCAPGDTVTITFPIGERTVREHIGGVDYTLVIRGNTVVAIDPPGKHVPLFEREHYRTGETPWRRVTRFVSDVPVAR